MKIYKKNNNLINYFIKEGHFDQSFKLNFDKDFKETNKRKKEFFNSKKEILSWWENANNQKMEGFYLDYKNNEWVRPKDLTYNDYLKCFDIVGTIMIHLFSIVKLKLYNK